MRGCFRLLSGGECILNLNGNLTDTHVKKLKNALGPRFCIPSLLPMTGRNVISPRAGAKAENDLKWVVEGNLRAMQDAKGEKNQLRSSVFVAFERARRKSLEVGLLIADCVRATLPNGVSVNSVKYGDAVQIQCYYSNSITVHRPFLLTRHSVGYLQYPKHERPTLWVVICFLKTSELSNLPEIWAALRPCHVVLSAPSQDSYELHYRAFEVGNNHFFCENEYGRSKSRKIARLRPQILRSRTTTQPNRAFLRTARLTRGSIFSKD